MYEHRRTSANASETSVIPQGESRNNPGKRTLTQGMVAKEPVQRKAESSQPSPAPTAAPASAPEIDGNLPYLDGLEQAFGADADPARPATKLASPSALPPEQIIRPEDYQGVAEILGMDESVLVAPVRPQETGSADKDAKDKKAETNTGIATQVAVDRFVSAAKKVEKDWGTLDKTSRAEKLGEAANQELATAGVPKVGVVIKDLGNTNGQLDFTPWNLDLNGKRFEASTVTADAMAPVATTVYHESRHAEQWFRMARLEAGKGKNGAQIATALSIKRTVADEAAGKPLSGDSQEAKEAGAWHKSVYGSDASARNQTLRNLKTHGQALRDAGTKSQEGAAKYKQLQTEKGADHADTKAALAAWKTAYTAYESAKTTFDATYAAYRALPEEADAWKLGDRVTAAYKDKGS